jgi:hypothetical protein
MKITNLIAKNTTTLDAIHPGEVFSRKGTLFIRGQFTDVHPIQIYVTKLTNGHVSTFMTDTQVTPVDTEVLVHNTETA